MDFIKSNWEYMTIVILCIDKAVALSPSKMDDLIWTMAKKAIKRASGKKQMLYGYLNCNWERDYTTPPWFSRLTTTDNSLSVVYTSPRIKEEDNA